VRNALLGLAVSGCVFALSYANGGFDTTTKAYAGISAWWLLGTGAALGLAVARARVDRLALVALGLFAAFAIWTLISMAWASDEGRAFAQFDQVSFYVAVLALAIAIGRIAPSSTIVGGVGLAISAIGLIALVSRLFPTTFGLQPGTTILSPLQNRLSFPLGYWNGLGIEVALAYPLLLSIMVSRRSRLVSALAALPLPILAAVMYLTSSRGAFVAAGVAVVAFLLLTPSRWPALAATAVAGIAGAITVGALDHRNELLLGDMTNPVAVQQGHRAGLIIGIVCVVTALAWVGLVELGGRVPTPSRVAGWATAGVIVVGALVAVGLSHPIAKFDAFKSNSFSVGGNTPYISGHLLSSTGSGRWQFWAAASSEFQAHPLNGGGAGSWQAWWLQHGTLGPFFTQYAHSLYLESLAELGIIGLLLIGGAIVVGVVGAVRSALSLRSGAVAAAAAAAIAFFAAAAYDWVWQLSGIAIVGVGLLGVALGARPSMRAGEWGRHFGVVRPLLALVAVAAIVPQVVVLAAQIHIRNSKAAHDAMNGTRAKSEALAAKAVEPWDASTWLQLALVENDLREYNAASSSIREAIERSPQDWTIWLAAAEIDAYRGDAAAVRRDFAKVRLLNPHASILQGRS